MHKHVPPAEIEPQSPPTDEPGIIPVLLPENPASLVYEHRQNARVVAFRADIAVHTNEDEVNEAISVEVQEYKKDLRTGIREGWLHEDAGAALDKLDDVKIVSGAALDKYISKGAGGFHRPEENTVVIRYGREKSSKLSKHDRIAVNMAIGLKHELNHAVLGRFSHAWLNEAVTEHIALSMNYEQPEIVHPDLRSAHRGGYVDGRMLLDQLLTCGEKPLPVSLFTKAYSHPEGEEGIAFAEMNRQLDESWGVNDVLGKLNRRIDSYQALLREDKSLTPLQVQKEAIKRASADLREAEKQRKALTSVA